MKWESIRSKYERIQEIIVEFYPKANEESKDIPNLKNCNCIVFFAVHVFSLIKKLIPHSYDTVFTLAKLHKKSLRCRYRFVVYDLEQRSVSTVIRNKKCSQIFVLSVNKSPFQYAFSNTTESYTV